MIPKVSIKFEKDQSKNPVKIQIENQAKDHIEKLNQFENFECMIKTEKDFDIEVQDEEGKTINEVVNRNTNADVKFKSKVAVLQTNIHNMVDMLIIVWCSRFYK